jgi:alpha-tubulin suppressor-like RCC1 family protein
MADGHVACWGPNTSGQIGSGDPAATVLAPEYVPGITTAVQVAVAYGTSCALLANGTVQCWGDNTYGQCSSPMGGGCAGPQTILNADLTPLDNVEKITTGSAYTGTEICALRLGSVLCWGHCGDGQCSTGASFVSSTPVPMLSAPSTPFTTASAISASQDASMCVLLADQTVHCSGYQADGRLGDGVTGQNEILMADTVLSTGPISGDPETPLVGVGSIACGWDHCCSVQNADHSVVNCWGAGYLYANTSVQGLSGPVSNVSAGYGHACAALAGGQAQCWGYGDQGQLGDGLSATSASAVTVTGLPASPVTSVAAAQSFSCAVLQNGEAYCWGIGSSGELGDGSGQSSPVPVRVSVPQ